MKPYVVIVYLSMMLIVDRFVADLSFCKVVAINVVNVNVVAFYFRCCKMQNLIIVAVSICSVATIIVRTIPYVVLFLFQIEKFKRANLQTLAYIQLYNAVAWCCTFFADRLIVAINAGLLTCACPFMLIA